MKDLKLKYFIAVNIGFALFGVIGVLGGILARNDVWTPLLESIGTGLLAAGLVNILDRAITLEPKVVEAKQRIEVVAEQRSSTPKDVLDLKYTAEKVDVIGINLNFFLEELVNDPQEQLINRLLYNKLQLRMFLLHPDSPYLVQRAHEDGVDPAELVRRQKQAISYCVKFYDQLSFRFKSASSSPSLSSRNTGVLQIKLLSFCPYITVYRN